MTYKLRLLISVVFVGLCLNSFQAQSLNDALLAYWNFDNFNGQSGTMYQGTPNSVELTAKGKKGSGIHLNGGNSSLSISTGLNLFNQYTIALWYKPEELENDRIVFSQYSKTSDRRFELRCNKTSLSYLCQDGRGNKHNFESKKIVLKPGQFYFIAITQKNDLLVIYLNQDKILEIDGVEINIREEQFRDVFTLGTSQKGKISVKGVVDEFLVYERCINEEEINALYQLESPDLLNETPPEAKPNPSRIRGREMKLIAPAFEVENDTVRIEYFDKDKVDFDTVSIYFNGRPVVEKQLVDKNKKSVRVIALPDQDNYVSVVAENLGDIPPNTASVVVYYGRQKKELKVNSDFSSNGTIIFRYNKSSSKFKPTPVRN
jgi:hypothetical protein